MKVLRSRKIVPLTTTPITKTKRKTKTKTKTKIEPSTPTQIQEPILQSPTPTPTPMSPASIGLGSDSVSVAGVTRRRSLRLVSKSGEKGTEEDKGGVFVGNGEMGIIDSLDLGFAGLSVKASDEDKSNSKGGALRGFRDDGFNRKLSIDLNVLGSAEEEEEEEGLRGFGEVGLGSNLGIDTSTTTPKSNKSVKEEPKRKRRLSIDLNVLGSGSEYSVEDEENGKGYLSLRSGKRVVKKRMSGDVDGGGLGREVIDLEVETGDRRLRREEKGKGKLALDDLEANNGVQVEELDLDLDLECAVDVTKLNNEGQGSGGNEKGKRKLGGASDGGVDENSANKSRRRYSREEKGKDKLVRDSSVPNGGEKLELSLNSEVKNSDKDVILLDETRIGNADKREMADNVASLDQTKVGKANTREIDSSRRDYMERFREIARENASRFAHFSSQEEEDENNVPTEAEAEPEIEDWPGPFSTAMKIIRDREAKNKRVESYSSDKSKPAPVIWTPRYGQNHRKPSVPSLKELCLIILSQNADAIASLENVPDALRHKLSQLLCDSRRMNNHVFELLIRGSPTEVRLRDCSWLTEEQFTDSFQTCDTSNLTVLQLDQCGRCMSDYVLPSTLARSSNSLAALTTLSLSGACRLSDDGLSKLVSSASALRSLNLSQCSLLTSSSIDTLADSLGSVLRELNLTDCQSLDSMLILPALKKFEQLQVLSLAGIQNVGDDFLKEFLTARGHNIKELVLADCVKLTDSSFKVISETCPGLCAIDLVNLSKLTDFAIGYLANGCRAIQKLKLCRNSFSDEAIAAFLETSGEWLKELSLNNVKKVGYNTAASLGRRSKRLHTLDLSWCRNLTDEAVGFIVDNCLSLRVLKLFGCTQITKVFLDGHSNPDVQIIGLMMRPVLEHVKVPDHEEGPLLYYS
ncbi:uncharacterized protein LOC112039828 [Quercus suber]|uniref:F-box protein skp2a n=1 Tax=Quercus suber TaxID=58331 RepID=A0AAW0M3I3_QUESU|nr:uncharacterized protein LOC112039828 [Quercus suber]